MPDGLTFISVILGFGFVVFAGAKLGAGSPAALAGMFGPHEARDWPIGVQEANAPRFVFARPSTQSAPASAPGDVTGEAPTPEIEELYAGPIRS